MGSYELMELLEYMNERGAFKSALREGEYSEEEQVWRHIATELTKVRAITQQAYGGKPGQIRTFPTKGEIREAAEAEVETADRREDFFSFADRTPFGGE